MKYILTLGFLFATIGIYAQLGIGTTNPQADLHVAGDLLVQDEFLLRSVNTVTPTDENFKLIARSKDSSPVGEIKELDVNAISVARVNCINYHFTNISLDNLSDLDLQYDTSKYVVGIANFRYVGDAIKKVSISGNKKSIGQFVVHTFESGGTWHLEIQNRSLDLMASESLEYYITLIVYDRSYYKFLPTITTDLGGSSSGTASSVPNLN